MGPFFMGGSMEIRRLDLKRAHFGSREEEWSYQTLLLVNEINEKLGKIYDLFSRMEGEIKSLKESAGERVKVEYRVEEKKMNQNTSTGKRGRKKKAKADDIT